MFTLTCHREETESNAGRWEGGWGGARGAANKGEKIKSDQQRTGCRNTQLGLWGREFCFLAGAATRLIQKVAVRSCGSERRDLRGRENIENTAQDEPSGRISAAFTIIRDL